VEADDDAIGRWASRCVGVSMAGNGAVDLAWAVNVAIVVKVAQVKVAVLHGGGRGVGH